MVAQNRDEQLDADALIAKWIERNPHRGGGGEVRLKEYCVSVWALVGYLQGMDWDVARVAESFDLPEEAVAAALAYYERDDRNRILIDDRIAANLE